jgi:peptidyl-prolyl cis-trans isomerase SurA
VDFNQLKLSYSCCLIAGLFISLFFSNPLQAGVPLDRIVAIVNDDVIMQSELELRTRTLLKQMSEQNAQIPPLDILQRQVLENMIVSKLQLQFAAVTGILVDDGTLNQTINNIASQNKVTLTQFREILEKEGYDYQRFREDIRNEIALSRLKQRQVDNRISVTDSEIDNYLSNEQVQGVLENEYRLSHILIAFPEGATDEEKEQAGLVAGKVLEDLASGSDFAKLAASISDGQQAQSGGDLGWKKEGEIPGLFTDYLKAMREGDISKLIESPSGFHIIKLTGLRNAEENIVTQTHARHILVTPTEIQTEEDVVNRINQLKLRLDGGDDFADLAKSHSDDKVSAIKGGDLGWTSPGDMVPDFENEMNNLKPGEISHPFKTQFGWHIVQVLERREYDNSQELKRARAREIIRAKKIDEATQNWLRSLRDEAYVEYRLDDT